MKRRIKDVVSLRNVKSDDTNMPYIALENIKSWDATYVETNATSDGINNVFKKNDILFGKLRPYLAKGYIPQYEGVCSSEFLVMKANEDISNKYLLYTFLSHSLIDYISNQVAGVKMPRTNWVSFSNISIEVPEYESQLAIVNYLDSRTSTIEQRISILTKKQECYTRLKSSIINRAVTKGLNPDVEFKDSGIDWIGEIPESWDVRRGKDLLMITSGFPADSNSFTMDSSCIPLVRIRDIFSKETEMFYAGVFPTWAILKHNDLLIGMDGEFNVSKWKGNVALLNQRVCKIESYDMDNSYLSYVIGFPLNELNTKTNSTTVKHLSVYGINGLYLPYPSLLEQKEIASYLDDKCSKIDTAIENIEKQIDALKRLKRALINEVVTGKREV